MIENFAFAFFLCEYTSIPVCQYQDPCTSDRVITEMAVRCTVVAWLQEEVKCERLKPSVADEARRVKVNPRHEGTL